MISKMKQHPYISGILLSLISYLLFLGIVQVLRLFVDGPAWKYVSTAQRIIFGIVELVILLRLYPNRKPSNMFSLRMTKKDWLCSSGILIFTLYYILYLIFGASDYSELTPFLVIGIVLQQAATGFWEELTFRAFFLEGAIQRDPSNLRLKLGLTLISGAFFGVGHAIECDSWERALFRFATTGLMGIAFAVIYLSSGNLLLAMSLHALYDIPANLFGYANTYRIGCFGQALDDSFYAMYAVVALPVILYWVHEIVVQRKKIGRK